MARSRMVCDPDQEHGDEDCDANRVDVVSSSYLNVFMITTLSNLPLIQALPPI